MANDRDDDGKQEKEEEDYMTMEIPGMDEPELSAGDTAEQGKSQQEGSILGNDSKALRMMTQMGFDPSKGLGKNKEGIVHPIQVQLKHGRAGIGLETQLKKHKLETDTKDRQDKQNYIQRKRQLVEENKWNGEYTKIRGICIDLDEYDLSEKELPSNIIYRGYVKDQRLKKEMHILRERLMYGEETQQEITENDNDNDKDNESDEREDKLEKQSVEFEELSFKEKFDLANEYLRDNHNYCFWCGCQISETCPGPDEQDHDI